MSRQETGKLFQSLIPVVGSIFSSSLIFGLDYVFWSILNTFYNFLQKRLTAAKLGNVHLHIYGSTKENDDIGIMGTMFKEIADAFQQLEDIGETSSQLADCIQKPEEPKPQIRTIWMIFSFLLVTNTLTSPWILRIRRYICEIHRPTRERQRINWLRMNIKMTRGKGYAKRVKVFMQLSSKNGLMGWIARIVTGKTYYRCLVCLKAGKRTSEEFLPCLTPGCGAYLCLDCLPYLKNECTRCRLQLIQAPGITNDDISDDDYEDANKSLFRFVF